MKLRTVSVLSSLLLSIVSVNAKETVLTEFSWQQLADAGQLKAGKVETLPDQSVALKIENNGSGALQTTYLTVEQPKITTDFYAITGEVKYESVEGEGFLEMWNHFGGTGAYFTRTMGESGPMGKLRGTSDWRPFSLPFNATGAKSHPSKLVLNLHLPGKGTVYLRSLKLVESTSTGLMPNQWGARGLDPLAGVLGGIGGAVIGCLGSLMEWCAKRGKSRTFVLMGCKVLIALGAAATVAGLAGLVLQQAFSSWYVLLLIGVLLVLIFPFRLRRYQQVYQDLELRRMSALDAM